MKIVVNTDSRPSRPARKETAKRKRGLIRRTEPEAAETQTPVSDEAMVTDASETLQVNVMADVAEEFSGVPADFVPPGVQVPSQDVADEETESVPPPEFDEQAQVESFEQTSDEETVQSAPPTLHLSQKSKEGVTDDNANLDEEEDVAGVPDEEPGRKAKGLRKLRKNKSEKAPKPTKAKKERRGFRSKKSADSESVQDSVDTQNDELEFTAWAPGVGDEAADSSRAAKPNPLSIVITVVELFGTSALMFFIGTQVGELILKQTLSAVVGG